MNFVRYTPPRATPSVRLSPLGCSSLQVWMATEVEDYLWQSGRLSSDEQGGILYGKVRSLEDGYLTVIYAATHLSEAQAGRTHITMLAETQRHSDRLIKQCFPNAMRVGFWHTHPGMPPEPSPTDLSTMACDCAEPWLVQLLLDPYGSQERPPRMKLFAGQLGEPVEGLLVAPRGRLRRLLIPRSEPVKKKTGWLEHMLASLRDITGRASLRKMVK